MRNLRVLCALALLAGATALQAQTSNPPTNDPAITALSVMGVVSELKPDAHQVIVTTAAGSQVTVTLSDRTVYMRIPPGEKTKDKFIKIAPTDFATGDSVFARPHVRRSKEHARARVLCDEQGRHRGEERTGTQRVE
jgi:hypothetical protein